MGFEDFIKKKNSGGFTLHSLKPTLKLVLDLKIYFYAFVYSIYKFIMVKNSW